MAEHAWDEVKEKFNVALALSDDERERYLKDLSTESTQLHDEVAELLAHHDSANDMDFLKSLKIGKRTEADLAETIAAALPTIGMESSEHTVSLTGLKTLDSHELTADFKLNQPDSFNTLSTAAPIDNSKFVGEIGDYQLIEQIGRGGMGVVYKAYQRSVGRTVALKVIAAGSLCAPEDIARFHDEASAAGRLNHPGIVQVYDAGEHNGTHYFSMAYVEGETLASYVGVNKPRLEPRRAAELIESVCRAVQYAHDRAIWHRDIKPANIMLDKSGQPLLTDFGLAKLVGDEGMTQTGQVMGTPNYMAPEQAKGAHDQVSNRTDVYSLGATLYALLAGIPAFTGKTLIETLRKVESAAPASLAFKGSPVPLDLWIICEKCLSKRPEDRYESASALADDLQRYLQGFPISARAVGYWTRLVRWSQRNPAIATLLGAIAVTLVVATMVSIGFAVQARAAQVRAEANLATIERVLDEVLISVSEGELANDPGTQKVRERLLGIAQNYFKELSNSQQVSMLKVANAGYLLGRVQFSLGLDDVAIKTLQNALTIQINSLQEAGDQVEALTKIAATHKEFSRIAEKKWSDRGVSGSSEEAKEALAISLKHEKACLDYRKLALNLDPSNKELQRLLANAQMGLGLVLIQQGSWDPESKAFSQAEELLTSAQKAWDDLLAKYPKDPTLLKDSARGHTALATLRDSQAFDFVESDPDRYGELLKQSLELRTAAAQKYEEVPSDYVTPEIRYLKAYCYYTCAQSHWQLDQVDEAITSYRKALSVFRSLLMSSPLVDSYRVGVTQTQFNLSQLYFVSSQDALGYEYVREFQQTLVDALTIDPKDANAAELLIDYTKSIAESLAGSGLFQEALNQIEQAKTMLQDIPVNKSDKPSIDSVVERFEAEAEVLREKINTENRSI